MMEYHIPIKNYMVDRSHFFGKNETKDNFYVRYVYTHLEKSLKKEFGK